MRRLEVLMARTRLVDLDNDEAGRERRSADDVEEKVGEGAGAFLLGGVGGLENEDCLDGEKKAGGVEKGVGGEEDELLREDGSPYYCCENPNSGLRDGRRANPQVLMEWPAFDLAGISSASKERLLLACSADCRGVRDPSCRGHAMKTHAVEGGGGG